MEYDDTISKLKFITKIKKGDKINIKNMSIYPDGFLTKILRTFISVDNRSNTFMFLKSTILQSFNLLQNLLSKTSNKNMSINIIEDIKRSKEGIKNLKVTYSSDIMLCCQLDFLLEEIDTKLLEIEEKFPVYLNV